MTHVVIYITHDAVTEYERNGWKVTWYGWRGDGLACFIASFRCCEAHA
jgi:hypothetical protein